MAGATLTGDWSKLQRGLKNMSSLSMTEIHRLISGTLLSSTQLRFRQQVSPSGAVWPKSRRAMREGGQTLRDNSLLYNSLTRKYGVNFAAVGTNRPGAGVHQFGAVIRPKAAKALAIPLSKEARTAIGPKMFPAELDLVWPRGNKFGWLVEHTAGRGKSGRGAKSRLHYLLAPQVTIPARAFLGINDRDKFNIRQLTGLYLKRRLS